MLRLIAGPSFEANAASIDHGLSTIDLNISDVVFNFSVAALVIEPHAISV